MAEIYMTPIQVRETAKEFDKLCKTQREIMKNMRIIVLGLSQTWQGEAQRAYENKFIIQSNKINEFIISMERFLKIASEAADSIEKVDSAMVSYINCL